MSIELQVWREACRRIELNDFVERIVPLLAEHFPLDQVLIRRLDLQANRLETLTGDGAQRPALPLRTRTELLSEEALRVATWCEGQKPISGLRETSPMLELLVPVGLQHSVLAGPLYQKGEGDKGARGVVIFSALPRTRFDRTHEALLVTLLEAFSMALFLDRQFHELARLREAAEADSRAALSRLGRGDIVDKIVGEDGGLREVMQKVNQVAPTYAPVLLLGDTGSGKEVVARAIHGRSRRADGPVLRVNCGAIPPEIIDSELFGHERGSFTGAVNMRRGWFERADGGTLFLDEIGELPLAAQVRLLRVLQDGSFERVGGQRTVTVDVRIIAATHMDLPSMVQAGSFRLDLWYRLSVFIIRLPPLRDHMEDLPELVRYFAARVGRRLGGRPIEPTLADIQRLSRHDWPGNVRELSALIERAAILGNLEHLEVEAAMAGTHVMLSAPQPLLDPRYNRPQNGMAAASVEDEGHDQRELLTRPRHHPGVEGTHRAGMEGVGMRGEGVASLNAAMAEHIVRALQTTRGRIEGPFGAAVLLGINPHTLRARMRKLKIDWSAFRHKRAE